MNGVSGRVLGAIIAGWRRSGRSLAGIAEAAGLDEAGLARPPARIPWETFKRILDRMAVELGPPDELRRFAEQFVDSDQFRLFKVVGRVLATPRDVYSVGVRWIGPSLFPMTRAELWDGADGLLIERVVLERGYADCPALFHLLHGALISLPGTWGHGPSEVTLDLAPGVATYSIRPCSVRRGFLATASRAMRARLAFPRMLQEIESQQRAITDAYQDLRVANARISAQAADLARVDAIGRELSRDVDLDRVLDGLVRILREAFDFSGLEIWLTPVQGEPGESVTPLSGPMRRVRQWGRLEGPGEHRAPFEAAGRRLGELVVRHDAADAGGATNLLGLLIPWITLAIDNALTYARLSIHAESLEARVRERTARLLDANQALVREIDERKRANEALLLSEAQLRASERLASIGTLAAGIAHEINNPVGSILAAAQLAKIMRKDPSTTSQIDAALADIESEARRCGEIVRSVLQFARQERTDKRKCALKDLVNRSVRICTPFADSCNTRIVADLRTQSIEIHANPTQIEQALVNLIRNAVESGSPEVRVTLSLLPGGQRASISVADDGSGIPESERLRVLEPFYTTRRETGGTGLGLSVVHGIALEHGGTLAIDSRPGRGSTMTLTLPCREDPPGPPRVRTGD